MLFNNLTTERRASLIVKNSRFYIEIAKFVQAYTTIVKNPNIFLTEVGEKTINEKKQHLTWNQLIKIMQTCDLGFKTPPTRMDLAVYYNYALEIGSVTALDKRIASVDEVAEAQKHYYNYIDEQKNIAEEAYQRQKKIYEARKREMSYIDGKIASARAVHWFSAIMMFVGIVLGLVGISSFLIENTFVDAIGKLIPVWEPRYVGGIVLIVIMFLLFFLFNGLFVSSMRKSVKLKYASIAIFARGDELLAKEQLLKNKLDAINKDYRIIQTELHDKNKTFDVKHNIEVLKTTNKFYKELCEADELSEAAEMISNMGSDNDDFAPIKLSKEQEENMRQVKREAVGLAGQLDEEAYKAKFEKSRKEKDDKKSEEKEEGDKSQEKAEAKYEEAKKAEQERIEDERRNQEEIERQRKEREQASFNESVDYVKDILGMSEEK